MTTALDLEAIKSKQQRMWASGDYAAVAARIHPIAELLVEAADLRAGSSVLDVATGSGNAALAAARCDCLVTGVDYVPDLLERARLRALAEGLEGEFVEGDAEWLPFPDASFDAVLSCVGVMFAPDQQRAAAEITRVCRPGGTIALASWTPDGFIGHLLRTVGRYVPPPAGVRPPPQWGTEDRLQELFAGEVSAIRTAERTYVFRFASASAMVDFFRTNYGPTLKAFEALPTTEQERLHADLVDLCARHNRAGTDSLAIPSTYLEAVMVRN